VPPAHAEATPLLLAAPKKPVSKNDPRFAEAKRLFEQGAELYGKGSYEEAIVAWQKSYDLSGKELILESIANAYERLGQFEKAREYLAKWRESAPPEEQADLDARLAKLDERIEREKVERAKAEKEAREKEEAAERRRREEANRTKLFIPGVIIGGTGAAIAITGGVLDILAATRRPNASEVCKPLGDRQLCRSSARGDIESSNTFATVGDILLITGVAAAAVGGVLIYTQRSKGKENAPKTAVAPIVLPGHGGGLVVGGAF
jgi:tetratricopeptide (TPR) repeat protein